MPAPNVSIEIRQQTVETRSHDGISIPALHALAVATTAYHEAFPDSFESARLEYEIALAQFRAAYKGLTTPALSKTGIA